MDISPLQAPGAASLQDWVRHRTDKPSESGDAWNDGVPPPGIWSSAVARSGSYSALGSEYDNFLFAPIGIERSGMLLSVVSLLGRMDLDPWEEAARLAGLSAHCAAQKLAALLRALPNPVPQLDPDGAAARLIALLPRRNADPTVGSQPGVAR
jgi:hypothetical protein